MADTMVGRCRICGCTELAACDLGEDGPCGWFDGSRTLCDNPDCVKAGARLRIEPADPAGFKAVQVKAFDGDLVDQLLQAIEGRPALDDLPAIADLAAKVRRSQTVAYACPAPNLIEVTTLADPEPRFINRAWPD